MRGWLLDTNVLSELRKPKPDRRVTQFVAAQPGELLFISEITFGEIRYGIEKLNDSGRRADIRLWLDRELRPLFAGRTLAITEDVIVRWKTMLAEGQRRGHTF
ncbi:MAG: PIN domain-containing protein, partial [Xanthobacteraceae bacterium]